ncbi:MAG: 2-amino-4-hydroxy-6-hydroxymethyldihydropteridine diphosphokinase [Bacteroidales bacterium]|nr:2-amino-4-hydroxy-6-hydroxymethyldihydropteridine diphosphokinase [Bacteroidales bacterium]
MMKLSADSLPGRSKVMVGLGSNMGNRAHCLSRAIAILREEAGEIIALSSVWETEPWGFEADDHQSGRPSRGALRQTTCS